MIEIGRKRRIGIRRKKKGILSIWNYYPPKKLYFGNLPANEQDYIKIRVDSQIEWYDKKSIISQKKYKLLTFIILVCSTVSPLFVNLLPVGFVSKLVISVLGIIVTVSQSIINLNKYNEIWISYRTTCEILQKERNMYITNSGIYADDNDFHIFSERIESIISNENINWAGLNKAEKKEKK